MNDDKFYDKYFNPDDLKSGFNDMYIERHKHIEALRERISKYGLSERDMDKLFEIVTKAEFDIEKLKRDFNSKKYNYEILEKFKKDILAIQLKMKEDFEKKLKEMIEKKYGKNGFNPQQVQQQTKQQSSQQNNSPFSFTFDDNQNSGNNFFNA